MNDHEFGQKVIRVDELLRAMRVASPQSFAEAEIVQRRVAELGALVKELLACASDSGERA
jgi:hypothetical protein